MQNYATNMAENTSLQLSSEKIISPLAMLWNLFSTLMADPSLVEPDLLNQSLSGIFLALERRGHKTMMPAAETSLSVNIRLNILANPSRSWCSADFEDDLHMSGATLRRRLAEENTSLRRLMREARLYYGMNLLQTTRKSVKLVALECGYSSQSCFTRNFISYFGTEPSSVLRTHS